MKTKATSLTPERVAEYLTKERLTERQTIFALTLPCLQEFGPFLNISEASTQGQIAAIFNDWETLLKGLIAKGIYLAARGREGVYIQHYFFTDNEATLSYRRNLMLNTLANGFYVSPWDLSISNDPKSGGPLPSFLALWESDFAFYQDGHSSGRKKGSKERIKCEWQSQCQSQCQSQINGNANRYANPQSVISNPNEENKNSRNINSQSSIINGGEPEQANPDGAGNGDKADESKPDMVIDGDLGDFDSKLSALKRSDEIEEAERDISHTPYDDGSIDRSLTPWVELWLHYPSHKQRAAILRGIKGEKRSRFLVLLPKDQVAEASAIIDEEPF